MKPFNLTDALAGKPVITRDGRAVTKLTNFQTTEFPLIGVVEGGETASFFRLDGKFFNNEADSAFDLFMKTTTRTLYVNLWKNEDHGFPFFHSSVHHSLEQANAESTISHKGYKKTLVERFTYTFEE